MPSAQSTVSKPTRSTTPTRPSTTGGAIHFQPTPAKKITDSPAKSTSIAVPKSGWRMMRPTGTASSTPATAKSSGRNWPSRFWNHQASIKGMAIFMISLGWITTPILSQRRAPFLVTPKIATAINSATPMVYSGTASVIRRWGGICAATNITVAAISILRAWSEKRLPKS